MSAKSATATRGWATTRGLLIVIVSLLVVSATWLLLRLNGLRALQAEEASLRRQLAEQKILFPLYRELQGMREATPSWQRLMPSTTGALTKADVEALPETYAALAQAHRVEISLVSPRLQPDAKGASHLLVDLDLRGALPDLGAFALAVAGQPGIEEIHALEVKPGQVSEELSLTLELALE